MSGYRFSSLGGVRTALLLALLRRVVDPHIVACTAILIKTSVSPARVYRVHLKYAPARSGASSIIVKTIAPDWPDDPDGAEREWRFYRHLFPRLDMARPFVYFSGVDPASGLAAVIMEDISADYRFPSDRHVWTEAEARCVLRAYARLHVRGERCLPPEHERGWMWRMALQAKTWSVAELLALAHDLADWGVWPALPGLERLIRRTLDDMPVFASSPATLLHNDVTPANAALPHILDGEAILLDWEMAGWGMAELDLAFMFTQPFRSERDIDRDAALDFYWEQRHALDGRRPSAAERQAAQAHADALWALSLMVVAHKVAAHPYPPGSAPARYWQSMHTVVIERLRQLSSR